MAKRVIAALLVLVTLAGALGGCGKKLDENETAMLEAWKSCLETEEQIFGYVLWALDYARQFAEDNSWDSLMKARAACSAALLALQELELPEAALTSGQCETLMAKGIEADVVTLEFENLETQAAQKQVTLNCLLALLLDDVYLNAGRERLGGWVENSRSMVELEAEYLCLTTNYLLLQLKENSLWKEMKEVYPVIGAGCQDWHRDPDALMESCDLVLDAIEAGTGEEQEYLGIAEYTLGIVEDAANSGDLARLAGQMNTLSGVPAYIPEPGWFTGEELWLYLVTDDASGEKRLVEAGEDISRTPSACYISCGNVSLEEAEAYADVLTVWGWEPYVDWNQETQEYQILVSGAESAMLVSWTQEGTVLYLTEPVACLIPNLYLMAMAVE